MRYFLPIAFLAACDGLMLPTAPRASPPTMAARKKPTRRQVINGEAASDSAYKSFVKGGGGEATIFVIAGAIAAFGGSVRGNLYDDLAELQTTSKSLDSVAPPTVNLIPTVAAGKVTVEVVAPKVAGDYVDYMWLKDANGEIFSARSFKPGGEAILTGIFSKGQKIVPCFHTHDGNGIKEGAAFTTS